MFEMLLYVKQVDSCYSIEIRDIFYYLLLQIFCRFGSWSWILFI